MLDRVVQTARCFKSQYNEEEIEMMEDSLTRKQRELYWRERRYACLRDEAAEDLQVHTITPPADTTSA